MIMICTVACYMCVMSYTFVCESVTINLIETTKLFIDVMCTVEFGMGEGISGIYTFFISGK